MLPEYYSLKRKAFPFQERGDIVQSLFSPKTMSSFLSQLTWRHASKAFDPQKKVSDEDVQKILGAIQMAPSSFGLQPYHISVITDSEIKQKIREIAWNQPQVTDCSHLLVFCSRNDTAKTRIDQYEEVASGGKLEIKEKLQEYMDMMRGAFENKSGEEQKIWADRQTYIALGFAMAACAELQIDSCPMEGFSPEKLDEMLELPEYLESVVLFPIGYRVEDPKRAKVRFSKEDIFSFVE